MYGLLVPPGIDPALVEMLERFADGAPDGSGRLEEALGYIKDDVRGELRGYLVDLEGTGTLSDAQIDAVVGKVIGIVDAVATMFEDDDSPMVGALSEFMREEFAPKATDGAMVLEDRLMAIANNGVHKHRQIRPKQPKRYDTKILPGRW